MSFSQDRADWLHRLAPADLAALFAYRRENADKMDENWDNAPDRIKAMPRHFVITLERDFR